MEKKKVLVIGNVGCSRCEIVKNILSHNNVAYDYTTLKDLKKEDSVKLLSEAKANGIFSMPIILVDDVIQTDDIQGVVAKCK